MSGYSTGQFTDAARQWLAHVGLMGIIILQVFFFLGIIISIVQDSRYLDRGLEVGGLSTKVFCNKVNNGNPRTTCEICLKLIIKITCFLFHVKTSLCY